MEVTPEKGQFSRPATTKPASGGLSTTGVRKAIANVLLSWQSTPSVEVLASIEDAPSTLREQAVEGASPEGAYWKGAVYMFADQIRNGDHARKVLAHEAVGHHSMQEMLGEEGYADVLSRIQLLKDANNQRILELAREVQRRYGELESDLEAMELIALMAEQRPSETPLQVLMRRVRELVRRFLK